jgi:hypothetical protein
VIASPAPIQRDNALNPTSPTRLPVAHRQSPRAEAARALDIAVLAPCHNEALTVAAVVEGFRVQLPGARIFVYDNNSTDETIAVAETAGAIVRRVPLQGKGNVVRRMFSDIDADIYVLVDGDGTYDPTAAPALIAKLVDEHLDMVCGVRVSTAAEAYRSGHRFGNALLTGLVREIFGRQFTDMLTGYRVFSRRFVKSFPAHSSGFEIETELTVHALQMRLPIGELETDYGARPEGSSSKLSTIRDGIRILAMISLLVREERPLQFFSTAAVICWLSAGVLAVPVFFEFLRLGSVPRYPTLIVSVGMAMIGIVSFACGVILDTVSRARLEQRRLAYLAMPGTDTLVQAKRRSKD